MDIGGMLQGGPLPPSTTISTIAVKSGKMKLVIALLQSRDWFQLKVLEVQPELTKLGANFEEASDFLEAHDEVLRQIENKQSPVEELLRQADQLIATQKPRAEVYAAMAASLGLAWKDVNLHLQERRDILHLNVIYKKQESKCFEKMEQLESICHDNPVPVDIEAVQELLNQIQISKRGMLETVMAALQDGKILLDKLKEITQVGTLDSRPDYIRTSAQRAVSQVEHWLEALHDRRKDLELTWQSRKTQVEQYLALANLAIDLRNIESILNSRRSTLSQTFDTLGESVASSEELLKDHLLLLTEAKDLQDRLLKIIKSTEKLVTTGNCAGDQATTQAYNVLNECVKYIQDLEGREEILNKTVHFFKVAGTAIEALDEIQILITTTDLPATSPELAELHSNIANKLEELVEVPLAVGREILSEFEDETDGTKFVRQLLDEVENRRINLEGATTSHREHSLEVSEGLNNFLEKYNDLYSWLVTGAEAFLQGHQDMGSILVIARDFLKTHTELQTDFQRKESEMRSLISAVPSISADLNPAFQRDIDEKVECLQSQWFKLRSQLDNRVELARLYVKFHVLAADVSREFDAVDEQLRTSNVNENSLRQVEEKWFSIQQKYVQLSHVGRNFVADAQKVMDPQLDVKRASLCIDTVLEQLSNRQLVISDSWQAWQCSIDVKKEVRGLWEKIMTDSKRTLDWVSKLESQLYPILLEDYESAKDVIRELERKEQIVIPEVKKAQTEIELRVKAAESLALKGEAIPPENEEVVKQLQNIHDQLQKVLTDYEVLVQMLLTFFKNLSEIEKTLENIAKQNQLQYLPRDVREIDEIIKDHDASTQTLFELFKFTKTESESIITKIRNQEPETVQQKDVDKIENFLILKQKSFENGSLERKMQLEQHRILSQFDSDLQEINITLNELNNQLLSVRGQYGESLVSAKATSQAFIYFERTIQLLEERIKIFINSGEDLMNAELSSSPHIKRELNLLQKRWDDFYKQVQESRRLIDLSLTYFGLVEEAEDWFREGGKLLVTIARKTTTVKTPEEASVLLNEVETFLKPGEMKQDERIQKISELAQEIYGDESTKFMSPVLTENKEMIESFNLISEELNILAINLKEAEKERERLKKEQDELSVDLSVAKNEAAAAKAEAVAAKAAAAAAEEAKRAAEVAAKTLQESIDIKKIEITEISTSICVSEERGASPPKKLKVEECSPAFIVPLNDATVQEGSKFKFECKVVAVPEPVIAWYKEGISVENNPDYETSYDPVDGTCSLKIEETFNEDSARFTCRAKNSLGSDETSAVLTVKEIVIEEELSPPTFVTPLQSGTAKEGEFYELRCHAEGNPLPTVQWYKGDVCIDNSPDYTISYNNGEAVLRLEQVFLEDDSMYSCKASNRLGIEVTSAELKVEPIEPTETPRITTPLSNVMARAGQKIKLECVVVGIPEPEISWAQDNKVIKPTRDIKIQYENNQASCVISEAFPNHAGIYSVTAANLAGEVSSSCTVVVKGRLPNETSDSEMTSDVEPVKPSIQLPLKDICQFEGKRIRLDCIIVGSPEPEVIWYHDGQPVKESNDFQLLFQGDRCSLVINEAYLEDAGEYKVVAINSAGEASSTCQLSITAVNNENESRGVEIRELTPEVQGRPPQFTKLLADMLAVEGDKVLLECCVVGSPDPDIRWYLNNQSVDVSPRIQMDEDSDGNATLSIQNVLLSDKGVYTVKAANSFGDAKCFANLIVKPSLVDQPQAPSFKKILSDRTVRVGEAIKLECAVSGVPVPKIRWFFNEEPITIENKFKISSDGEVQTLLIEHAKKEHIGVISCQASNEVGQVSSSSKIFVEEPILHHDEYLIPFLEPTYTENMDSSIFTNKQMFVQTSSSSQMTTSTINGNQAQKEVHSYSSHDEQSMKQTDQNPLEMVKSHQASEFHQVNDQAPQLKEESSVVVSKDGQIEQETIKTNVSTGLPAITKQGRKSTAPRFIAPLQGKIVDQASDVVLEGIIDGYPQPSVTWSKNGQNITPTEKLSFDFNLNHVTLRLVNVDTKDSGRYSCTVSNSVGSVTSTADIVVKKTIFPPVLGRRLQAQCIKRGDRAKLEIEVTGTPDPTVTWYKDDQPVVSSELFRLQNQGNCHSLIIDSALTQHTGRYSVKATNAGGMAQSIADLTVIDSSPISFLSQVAPKTEDLLYISPHEQKKKEDLAMKMDKIITETSQSTKHISQPFANDQLQESLSITETTKTEKKITLKMERSPPPSSPLFMLPKRDIPEKVEVTEKKVETEEEQVVEEENENIERSSISKKSALDFFKNKMKEEEEQAKQASDLPKSKPILFIETKREVSEAPPASDVFSKQSEIISQFKSFHSTFEEVSQPKQEKKFDAISMAKESYTIQKGLENGYQENNLEMNGFDLKPEPPPEIGFIPKPEKVTKFGEDIAEKVKKLEEFQRVSSPIDAPSGGIRLIPPIFPKPETPKPTEIVREEKKQEIKTEESIYETLPPLAWLSEPSETIITKKEVREDFVQKKVSVTGERDWQAMKAPSTPFTNVSLSQQKKPEPASFGPCTDEPWLPSKDQKSLLRPAEPISVRPTSPRPSAEGVAMEKLWSKRKSPERQETKGSSIIRPSSCFEPARGPSPKPSAEGVQMEKLWTPRKSPERQGIFRPASSFEPMRCASPRPSADGVNMDKLWGAPAAKRPATVLGAIGRSGSPKPSQEGLAMDKIWAHKRESSLKKSWPPQQPQEEKPIIPWVASGDTKILPPQQTQEEKPIIPWTASGDTKGWIPVQSEAVQKKEVVRDSLMSSSTTTKTVSEQSYKSERFSSSGAVTSAPVPHYETFSNAEPTKSAPVQHYVSESRLIQQPTSIVGNISSETVVEKRTVQRESFESSSTSREISIKQPTKLSKVWPPPVDLQAPSLVRNANAPRTPPVRAASVPHDFDPILEPGPPPIVGFCPAPARRTSYVEAIEQELQNDLMKQPKKQLPGAVRIIPPPVKQEKHKEVKIQKESKKVETRFEKFPALEPFPYKPDPPKPKPSRCPPPPTPTKFIKGHFAESDYESDYELRIASKWRPYESDNEDLRYRKVRPPSVNTQSKRCVSTEPEPLPPSKFDQPPQFEGPPRPIIDHEYVKQIHSINKTTKTQQKQIKVEQKRKVQKTKPVSPPKLKPGSPPQLLENKIKPESPKAKNKLVRPPESGYMADTDEPRFFRQEVKEEQQISRQWSKKTTRQEKELISPKIVQQIPLTKPTEELEPFPFKPEPIRPEAKRSGPPPSTPSKFIKGEYKENEYESDYQSSWKLDDKTYKSVRPVLTPSSFNQQSGRSPTPPSAFEIPPHLDGPPRPKFEPIAPAPKSKIKVNEVLNTLEHSQKLIKPKPLTPKQSIDVPVLKPGSPPEIAFAPAYPHAVETSNIVSFQESTETSRRVVNVQQTTRTISFGKQQKKAPTPTKFVPVKFSGSDYDSDLEGIRIKPDFNYNRLGTQHIKRSTSVPPSQRQYESDSEVRRIQRVEEMKKKFSENSISSSLLPARKVEPDIFLKPGEPPEYGFSSGPVQAAKTYASQHMQDMTSSFKTKAQQFVHDVISDVKKPEKPILKTSSTKTNGVGHEPQAYREESRLAERGTKHIDPDTGLIYFKYDFGYEFGIILPGEGNKAVKGGGGVSEPKKPKLGFTGKSDSIDFPIIHETTKQTPKKFARVKWESESEMSEAEDIKRHSLPTSKAPHVYIPRPRWDSTPSPLSISPSLPSFSPGQPVAQASPWLRGVTPTQSSPGNMQKNVTSQNYDPPKTPNFITPMKDIAVVSGQTARFECIVQAEPQPNILWAKDGRILEDGPYYQIQYKNGVCRLSIPKAYPEDSGTYTCTATNMVGTAGTTASLQVPGERRGRRM